MKKMQENDCDVIIVGGGIAGCTSALLLARAGLSVILLERGAQAGSKNSSGGRIYTHTLSQILPDFAQSAPLERRVTQERLSMLTGDSMTTLDHRQTADAACSWTVLRARFDPWLMEQAQLAGAQCITDTQVEGLMKQGNRVTGVRIGDDLLTARAVILAEGANSLLAQRCLASPKPSAENMATGVKEVLALPREKLEERFGLEGDQGCAWLFSGQPTAGKVGGGFLYTHRDTLSLGVVCNLSQLSDSARSLPQMLDDFKQHPALRPLLKQAEVMEYSAHMIPEGGLNALAPLSGDGWLVAGDCAGFCLNAGHTVRGMDLAMMSAQAAAVTLIHAHRKSDFSAASLSLYREHLQRSTLWPLMTQYRHLPADLLRSPQAFSRYPQLSADMLHSLFHVGEQPSVPLRRLLWRHARRAGLWQLLKDLRKGARSL
ncbi:FAD-dependent oxidoreductase [Rahnella sp. BIGb0603]|uniref:FAD-dependent oxidoreductase n=1 Tax=Rahnella sp. BIGb0603 TaxID=2940612 RepID=UPI0038621983